MNEQNPFAIAATQAGGAIQVAQSQVAQEIQAQLVIAKKFPRDQHQCFQNIIEACKRHGLAEEATYLYARGGTQISGPSIRLLEVIAQNWGNFRSGVIELDNEDGESRLEAFAWDLQTNFHESKTFTIKHERYTKTGGIVKLEDPRDQYEHVANFAARRKRACMEAVIPKDVIDAAVDQCDITLKTGHTEPITDRVRKIVAAFAEFGVSVEMIERRLQHKLSAIIEQEVVVLRKIYTSIKDGMGKREDFFDLTEGPKPAKFEQKTTPADEKAEAAAGLAPAQAPTPPATATQPEFLDKMAKARAAKAEKEKAKAAEPAQAPAPAPPVTATATTATTATTAPNPTPAPAPTAAPAPSGGDLFQQASSENQLLTSVYEMLKEHNVNEEEVLAVLKYRKICPDNIEQMVQLPDELLKELSETENFNIISSQVRINRKRRTK